MALVGLLCTTGMLSIAWRTYRFVGRQVAAVWLPVIDIALVAVPTLLGAMVFVYTLKRAKSHS
jgi:hypothetical protein